MSAAMDHGRQPTCAGPDPDPIRPELALPPLSCDSHFHIFGPGDRFPYAEDAPFIPPDAPKKALFGLHRFLGFERGVIVQSSCHGNDHSAVLDALAVAEGRYCGVALLAPSTSPREVERLDAAGFCGVRFHFAPHLGPSPPLDDLRDIVKLVRPHGWHIAIHVMGHALLSVIDFINEIEAPVVIDHIGRTPVSEGAGGEAFSALRRLIDGGKVWVKLSGTDRITDQQYPYADAVAMARVLTAQAPERILWGTDWPHPNVRGAMPNDGRLVDLIADIAPDEAARRRMLVDNPAAFFRFG